MQKDPNILSELKEISPLLSQVHGLNVFKVPENYFNSLPVIIEERISSEKFVSTLPQNKANLSVPQGYFENLSATILNKIRSEENFEESELTAYPGISNIPKTNIFTIPENYFESLPGQILSKTSRRQKAKIFSIYQRPVLRYAVAAAVAVILFLSTWFTVGSISEHKNSFAVVNKHTVPDPAALQYNSSKAFDEGIASLSDDQITAYLQNHGSILDNDALIKNTDVSSLPDVMDYLINDEALDSYLNKISNNTFSK